MSALEIIAIAFICWIVLVTLFTPAIPYYVEAPPDLASDHFIHVLESTCHTTLEQYNRVEVFTNGTAFYPAMLDAIGKARQSIHMECYIFKPGEIGDRITAALAERARAGVRVTLLMDAIGSFGAFHRAKTALRDAGVQVEAYGRMRWYSLARLNNRTHRELLVVDGEVAFVGGAGIADWWWRPHRKKPMWRDMMLRVEGPVVSDIAGVVAENWLECCGEILTGVETYKPHERRGDAAAFVVKSSPSDRATASRVLFQLLIESAKRRVMLATPYFLPDRPFRKALRRTAARGVEIRVVVPGPETDQKWVRFASRRLYGRLVRDGIRIFEYGGGMTHVKAVLVDDLWAVVGTTNVDNRSFEHNDEVNLAIRNESVTRRIASDIERDIAHSREVTLNRWGRRSLFEKLIGPFAWILERQQ
jgi:cardiolipin synthase